MGNCQAIDAAALMIQHPSGKIERHYMPISASDVMHMNPGHYVSLIIPTAEPPPTTAENDSAKPVRITRVKLLRPNQTLALGHAYRLIPTQEVMKVLKAKKYAKMKQSRSTTPETTTATDKSNKIVVAEEDKYRSGFVESKSSDIEMNNNNQEVKKNIRKQKLPPKSWRPTLQSIAEGGR